MRRPSPLPASRSTGETESRTGPRTSRPPSGMTAAPDTEVDRTDVSDSGSAWTEGNPTAPIPLVPPGRDGGTGATKRPDGGARDDGTPSDGDGRVGIRDVWRASRARRRALRAEVRRFTVRSRRRRAVWIGAGAAIVLLVLGTLAAAYSPLFAVERIRVVGAESLDASSIEDALSDQVGTPLPLVDASSIKAELVAFPLIESYVLEARPPHELVVRIVERTPIGVIDSAAGFTVVDAAGVALSTSPERPEGFALLDVDGGAGSDAFAAVGQVLRSLPEALRANVSQAAASSPDDVTFVLGDSGADVAWGSADDSSLKVVLLENLMAIRPPSAGLTYDVSSTAAAVIR